MINVDVSCLLWWLHISSRPWELGHDFWKVKLLVRLTWEKTFITTALSPKPMKFTKTQSTLEGQVWTITLGLKCSGFCMNKPFLELKQIVFQLQANWIAELLICGSRWEFRQHLCSLTCLDFATLKHLVGICSLNCVSPQTELPAGSLSVTFHFSKQLPFKLPPSTQTCYTFASRSGFLS